MTAISLGACGSTPRHYQVIAPLHSRLTRERDITRSLGGVASNKGAKGTSQDNPIALSDDEAPEAVLRQSSRRFKQHQTKKIASTVYYPELPSPTHDGRLETERHRRTSRNTSPSVAISESNYRCIICTEDFPRASLPSCMTAACRHPPQTCQSCISSWISSRLKSSGQESLTCPQCNQRLNDVDIKAFTTPEVYEQYEALVLRSSLSDNPEFHWCMGPGCQYGQLHAGSNPIFKCAQCSFRSCIEHKVPWHDGLTCTEYDASINSRQKKMEEAASEKKIEQISRQCPGENCGWRIEKNEGCDHMTCSKCKTEFCWLCKADFNAIRRRGNMAHRRTCRYYSTNLPGL